MGDLFVWARRVMWWVVGGNCFVSVCVVDCFGVGVRFVFLVGCEFCGGVYGGEFGLGVFVVGF